eukprot:1401389-Ditylum_brightwellii.AAC.1
MDNTFLYSMTEEKAFRLLRCVCNTARKCNLMWKLSKCIWFPEVVEFVGVDIHKKGNAPAESKMARMRTWAQPDTPRAI